MAWRKVNYPIDKSPAHFTDYRTTLSSVRNEFVRNSAPLGSSLLLRRGGDRNKIRPSKVDLNRGPNIKPPTPRRFILQECVGAMQQVDGPQEDTTVPERFTTRTSEQRAFPLRRVLEMFHHTQESRGHLQPVQSDGRYVRYSVCSSRQSIIASKPNKLLHVQ